MENYSTPRPALIKIVAHLADLEYETVASDYDYGLQLAFNNAYRRILKVPVDMYIYGLLERWKIPVTLEDIKEATIDVLEYNGFEQTFTDEDWNNLQLITEEEREVFVSFRKPKELKTFPCQKLNTQKSYMAEFFEL